MRITPGFYKARGVSLIFSDVGEKKTKCAVVAFSILDDGPHKNVIIEWRGWLTEKTRERTAESLVYCGYDGEDEQSVTKNTVSLTIDDEEYTNDAGKTTVKSVVQWVNDGSRSGLSGTPMNEADRAEAKNGLKGLVLAKKQELEKSKPAGQADSFGFGHNAPAEGAPANPGGSKPMF